MEYERGWKYNEVLSISIFLLQSISLSLLQEKAVYSFFECWAANIL